MNYDLYLLYTPDEGWGIFSASTCPDLGAFPNWMYKKYTFPITQHQKVFIRLMDIKENFELNKTIPTKSTNIFPELSDLLEN
jgi:hypothetical protein